MLIQQVAATGVSRVYITVRKPVGARGFAAAHLAAPHSQETITTAVIGNELAPPTPTPVSAESRSEANLPALVER